MKRGFVWFILLGVSISIGGLSAQEDKYRVRQGNKAFAQKDLTQAEASYRKALQMNEGRAEARYGLARVLQGQDKIEEATSQYQTLLDSLTLALEGDKGEQTLRQMADVWHNLGNMAMKAKDYEKAVKAYQQSMILAPYDDETRYNLVLAQKLLQKDKNKEDNKQDQQQNQNQQEQQQQKQQDQQKNKEQQDQSNPPKGQQREDQQDQKQEASAQSRAQAEQTLDTYKQDDERTRQKAEMALRKQKNKGKNSPDRKRW